MIHPLETDLRSCPEIYTKQILIDRVVWAHNPLGTKLYERKWLVGVKWQEDLTSDRLIIFYEGTVTHMNLESENYREIFKCNGHTLTGYCI